MLRHFVDEQKKKQKTKQNKKKLQNKKKAHSPNLINNYGNVLLFSL